MRERLEKFSNKNVRERVKISQQECEILTDVRFSRMLERLENFSRRM
jgi:hypothetical protein